MPYRLYGERSELSIISLQVINGEWIAVPWVQVLFAIVYTLIVTVAVSGNVSVVLAVVTNKQLRTVRNVFIVRLLYRIF